MELVSPLNTYKLTVSYNGTGFLGWQTQVDEKNTIQGQINIALREISKSDKVKSLGSGRTDAGVHALAQIVKVEIPLDIDPEGLKKGLNSKIDSKIKILGVEKVDEKFNPVRDALWKEYCYLFTYGDDFGLPHFNDLKSHFRGDLDIDLMRMACKKFVGEHDFQNYFCVGTDVQSTVRRILHCDIERVEHFPFSLDHEKFYMLKIKGSGFLKQMVRLIMGALVNVGKGKSSPASIEDSLQTKLSDKLGPVAPPEGLYLNRVHYP
ncbi:MAG: tRNA pseudouridine(38-40) synthase TruA [Bacteriovoracaceae bacterium]|nr:tRNA pseudouridine(38-40) synthase TruA [Bacteriovoracaceae bacterium]